MNGSKVIFDKIISENQAIIDENLNKANAVADEIVKKAEADSADKVAKFEGTMQKTFDEIVKRRVTVANLDAKKMLMTARRQAIDNIFEKASKQIAIFDKQKYLDIISSILKKYAEDGDVVVLSKADKTRVTKKFIESQAKSLGIHLTVASEYGDFAGGVVLCGKNCDKNLSLDIELLSIKEELETQFADMLFKE